MRSHFDFNALRGLIRDEVRPVFQAGIANEAAHGLYAFGIRTVDTGEMGVATYNTEQNFKQCYGLDEDEEPDEMHLEDVNYWITRWLTSEWGVEWMDEHERSFSLEKPLKQFYREFPNFPEQHFGGAAYAAMVLALRDLDREGLFAPLGDRNRIVLFCEVSDSSEGGWLAQESARRLNPASVFRPYGKQLKQAIGPVKPAGDQYQSFLQWFEAHAA